MENARDAEFSIDTGLSDDLRPLRLNEALANPLADETLLYLPSKDLAVSLNPSARTIWELCDGKLTLVEMAQMIGERLGLMDTPLTLITDVKATVLELRKL